MTAEEWARIKDLFEAALDVPEEARDRYLREACGDAPQIYSTVAELLQDHESAGGGERPHRPAGAPALQSGDLIAGRFRILRFIAAGGMGEVYEALDERLHL